MSVLDRSTPAAPAPFSLDALDVRILQELNRNARASYREVAVALKISASTAMTRIKRLETAGIIRAYRIQLDYSKLGYDFTGLIEVTMRKGAQLPVQKKIAALDGVWAVYDVTGQSDSMVLVRTRTRAEFSRLVKNILAIDSVERTNTHIILNVIKEDETPFV